MKNTKKLIALSVATLLMVGSAMAQAKLYYVSIKDGDVITSSPIKEYPQPEEQAKRGHRITIMSDIEFQTIDGVGATFSEIGAQALMSLKKKEQADVVTALFGAESAAFSFCRTPVGSSDWASSGYSYAETADDYEMNSFSIERDQKSIVPAIKLAQTANPELKLFGSVYSPPGWMKNIGTIVDGRTNHRRNNLKNDAKTYGAYGLYFSKYIEAYKAEGINISRLVIQEDLDASLTSPSCSMSPEQVAKVATATREAFKKSGIDAQIWSGSFKTEAGGIDMLKFAANKDYVSSVDGISMQRTMLQYIYDVKALAPTTPVMLTTALVQNGNNDMRQANGRFAEIAGYINAGVSNFCYANMISTGTNSGVWDNKQNSLVVVNNGKVTYTPDYAVMSIFGRFLKAGAVRVASNGRGINNVVSVKCGDEIYVFVKNDRDTDFTFDCVDTVNGNFKILAPGKSIAVISYKVK